MQTTKASAFYQVPAFRHNAFLAASVAVLLDVAFLAAILVRQWGTLPASVIYQLTLGVLGLVLLWQVILSKQRLVYRLFENGKIALPESGSGLDIAPGVASDIAVRGLLIVAISVAMLLRAAGTLSRSQ